MLAGKEKPAQTYIDEHRGDRVAPLMYYYLNAALEHRRGHDRQAEQWLAQGDAHYSPANEQVFAESFRSLGWYTQRSERLIAAARRHDASATTPASLAVVELIPGQTPAPAANPAAAGPASRRPPRPPAQTRLPHHRTARAALANWTPRRCPRPPTATTCLTPVRPTARWNVRWPPPTPPTMPPLSRASPDPRAVYSKPVVLGRPTRATNPSRRPPPRRLPPLPRRPPPRLPTRRPRRPRRPPPPRPSRSSWKSTSRLTSSSWKRTYADARKLLDDADAIQPGQTTSTNLRAQIFKHYYETAYMAYKQGRLTTRPWSNSTRPDATQPNQPDALNLRGLTFSKQKDYEHAEAAFKRAITADPQFWAARFNYAELPFNYRNYTAARIAFRGTQRADRCLQAADARSELTQFKIFLTLLLEGKVDGARSFMNHLSFTGTTPARYFCQAALEFYAGNSDKAQAEIDQRQQGVPAPVGGHLQGILLPHRLADRPEQPGRRYRAVDGRRDPRRYAADRGSASPPPRRGFSGRSGNGHADPRAFAGCGCRRPRLPRRRSPWLWRPRCRPPPPPRPKRLARQLLRRTAPNRRKPPLERGRAKLSKQR